MGAQGTHCFPHYEHHYTRSCLAEELTNAAWASAEVRFRSSGFTEERHAGGQQATTCQTMQHVSEARGPMQPESDPVEKGPRINQLPEIF